MTGVSRRTVLGTLAGGVVGASMVAAGGSEAASAAVRLEQLSADGGSHEIRGEPSAVTLSGEIGYRFEIPDSEAMPELYQVSLHVGDDETEIDNAGARPSSRTESGTFEVSGDVLDAAGFSAGDFAPGKSERTVSVPVLVRLEVVGGGQTLATATQRDTADVTVTQAGYDASLHGSVGGELSVSVEE